MDNRTIVQNPMSPGTTQYNADDPEAHHASLSPSRFPALAKCIHYEPTQIDSAARARGIKIHQYCARFLRETVSSWPKEDIEYAKLGQWLAKEIRELIPDLRGVEQRVSILNYTVVPPEEITFGTCDAWGYDEEMLVLVDAKSGRHRDYKEQMAVYALALLEQEDWGVCSVIVLYCDDQTQDDYTFSRDEAEEIVMDVVARVREGTEPPKENEHCSFCAKRPVCPVWVIPASQALDIIANRTFDLEALKSDPVRLGEFLSKWHKAEKLVEEAHLKDTAKTYLTINKASVPGWSVQTVNGRTSYSEDEIEEIVLLLPELGMDRARSFINVDRKAFEQAWSSYSKKPVPVIPSQHAGTYQKLIKNK